MGSIYQSTRVLRSISGQSSKSGTSSRSASSARISALGDITAAADSGIKWDPTDDEQIINSALLQFLKAVALATPNSKVGWSMRRLRYNVAYNVASMETRTDGFLGELGSTSTQEAFSILEAKPRVLSREGDGRSTFFQKSAEVINWIMGDQKQGRKVPLQSLTTSDHSRLLIAQSRHEIFLVIATYDDEYVSYLNGKGSSSSTFMTMQQYGPYNINDAGHMKYLAEYLVEFYLHLSEPMSCGRLN
ncbi:uncharacterized protein KD926_003442 [Aspergillus affinis]|uniref:uncharacterized protein n=1 Tax=Aspergillus affinis TaxID=1070780 RepID=UPI0022FEC7AD|nr:uncharacterized protein KD926_003442 [Aspergillus affinis]KAI9035479.1 hypothetical protein KD926_003442 [Aspergillus affinis]